MFGERLNFVLKSKNMSAYRLSQLTGIANSTISDLRTGTNKVPALDFVVKVAQALNMTVSELIGEVEEKYTGKTKELADLVTRLSDEKIDILINTANAFYSKEEVTATSESLKKA